jgi:hypothetical protein
MDMVRLITTKKSGLSDVTCNVGRETRRLVSDGKEHSHPRSSIHCINFLTNYVDELSAIKSDFSSMKTGN